MNKFNNYVLIIIIIAMVSGGVLVSNRFNKLEEQVEFISTVEIEIPLIAGKQGETGERGERGYTGAKGDAGELPEGHWERYCVYHKNVYGYPTKGAMIREDSMGNCDRDWKVIKVWEK